MIDQELIQKLFEYNPWTGEFKRIGRLTRGGKIKPCDFLGSAKSIHGYFQYTIKNKTYDVHRLIFLYVEGHFPDFDVDHINGDRQDNRWENLRKVGRKENLKNSSRKKKPKSGIHGVGRQQRGGWRVWVGNNDYSGFQTVEDAEKFRLEKLCELGYSESHLKRSPWGED